MIYICLRYAYCGGGVSTLYCRIEITLLYAVFLDMMIPFLMLAIVDVCTFESQMDCT
jgi:hypothetical protein